jgi:hypothetical protein
MAGRTCGVAGTQAVAATGASSGQRLLRAAASRPRACYVTLSLQGCYTSCSAIVAPRSLTISWSYRMGRSSGSSRQPCKRSGHGAEHGHGDVGGRTSPAAPWSAQPHPATQSLLRLRISFQRPSQQFRVSFAPASPGWPTSESGSPACARVQVASRAEKSGGMARCGKRARSSATSTSCRRTRKGVRSRVTARRLGSRSKAQRVAGERAHKRSHAVAGCDP